MKYFHFIFTYSLLFTIIFFCSCSSGTGNGKNRQGISYTDKSSATDFADSLLIENTPVDTVSAAELHNTSSPVYQSTAFQSFFNKICTAFNSEDPSRINRFIHPKWGIYYVDRPGAIDVVDSSYRIEGFYKKVYLGNKRLKNLGCNLKAARIPDFTCDTEFTGCLTEEAKDFHRISDLKIALKEYGFNDNFSEQEQEHLKRFEHIITRNVVNFDKAIGLSFIFVDGKWYLAIIDLAKYSCSA